MSAPLAATDVREMFSEVRAGKLLGDFRGLLPVQIETLTGILQTLGSISLLHPEIAEIDLNPIIVSGDRPVVADALIVLAPEIA